MSRGLSGAKAAGHLLRLVFDLMPHLDQPDMPPEAESVIDRVRRALDLASGPLTTPQVALIAQTTALAAGECLTELSKTGGSVRVYLPNPAAARSVEAPRYIVAWTRGA